MTEFLPAVQGVLSARQPCVWGPMHDRGRIAAKIPQDTKAEPELFIFILIVVFMVKSRAIACAPYARFSM